MIRNMLINAQKVQNNKIAIIENDNYILYNELIQKTVAIQQQLSTTPFEKVAVFLPNSSDYIAALCAALMCGKTVVPIHVMLTSFEVASILEKTDTQIMLTSTQFSAHLQDLTATNEFLATNLNMIYVDKCVPANKDNSLIQVEIEKDQPILLSSTSGSTGAAKIVKLSENNITASLLGFIDKLALDNELSDNSEQDNYRFMIATPFTSIYGLMVLSLCLNYRFPIVIMPEPFTLPLFYKMVQEHKVTHYEGGAVVMLLMEQTVQRNIPYDISSLQNVGFGGSKISQETISVLHDTYKNIVFAQGYGMTEASPLITKNTSNRYEKMGSVGTAIKGVEIAIDVAGGITKKPYTEGEIIVSGPNVMLGYYEDEEATSKIIKKGYLYTGDMGYVDKEGFLYICGRKKNIIIVRGLNVFPEEVEATFLNSGLVQDCIVYGEKDAFGNEIVCADIIPFHSLLDLQKLKDYLSSRLAQYKLPHKIQVVTSIRKVASGKTERRNEGRDE